MIISCYAKLMELCQQEILILQGDWDGTIKGRRRNRTGGRGGKDNPNGVTIHLAFACAATAPKRRTPRPNPFREG